MATSSSTSAWDTDHREHGVDRVAEHHLRTAAAASTFCAERSSKSADRHGQGGRPRQERDEWGCSSRHPKGEGCDAAAGGSRQATADLPRFAPFVTFCLTRFQPGHFRRAPPAADRGASCCLGCPRSMAHLLGAGSSSQASQWHRGRHVQRSEILVTLGPFPCATRRRRLLSEMPAKPAVTFKLRTLGGLSRWTLDLAIWPPPCSARWREAPSRFARRFRAQQRLRGDLRWRKEKTRTPERLFLPINKPRHKSQ